jgi:hypothetical protein
LFQQVVFSRILSKSGSEAYKPKEMMAPESQYTTSGRANPSGIPFLYLSENEKTVVYEVRASSFWIALTHLLICSNKLYFLEYYQHNQLYQSN